MLMVLRPLFLPTVLRPLFLPHTNAHPPHTCLPLLSALSLHTRRYRTLTWPFRKAYLRTADEAAAGVTYALVSRDLQNAGGRLVSDGRVIEMSSKGSDPKLGIHTHTHTHACLCRSQHSSLSIARASLVLCAQHPFDMTPPLSRPCGAASSHPCAQPRNYGV